MAKLDLRRASSRRTKSFGDDEVRLSRWMDANAYVTWVVHPEPWSIETQVISS